MIERPRIESTEFGSIRVEGEVFTHDILIRLDGRIEPRQKGLSKAIYGTSHTISLDEARQVYQDGAARLIIGTGHLGLARLSDGAAALLAERGCSVEAMSTPEAVEAWNHTRVGQRVIGLFHVTC